MDIFVLSVLEYLIISGLAQITPLPDLKSKSEMTKDKNKSISETLEELFRLSQLVLIKFSPGFWG